MTTQGQIAGFIEDFISGELVAATPEETEAVQPFLRRLVEEFDYSKSQIQTRPQFRIKSSPSGQPKYPVEIAVFNDDRKDYDNLYMIVECKRRNRKDGLTQLKTYMGLCPAVIGVWFNGEEHLYLRKIVQRNGTITYEELPTLPKKGQSIAAIGKHLRRDLRLAVNLRTLFKDLRNYLAGSAKGITRDEPLAEQLIDVLFCKIYDEINTDMDEQLAFRVEIDEPAEHVQDRIIRLFNDKVKGEYEGVFDDTDNIILDADSIRYVVGELQGYCITEAEVDAMGEAFEAFIGRALKGPQGQFFTPRNVVRMAVEILEPQPGEYIIDPASGSGGFLIVALRRVWEELERDALQKGWSARILEGKKREIATRYFRGIDKDSFLSKVSKAYMALVGDGRSGIFCENSLDQPANWNTRTQNGISLNSFDVVLTNPPFGRDIKISKELYTQYELAYEWQKDKQTGRWQKSNRIARSNRAPQVLFLERCLQLLKEGGRMAIVLPDGMLSNPKDGYIFQFIKENAEVIALVDCPMSTFLPDTPTKTHVLFLRKKNRPQPTKIFMAYAKTCGHDKRGKPVSKQDATGKKLLDDDLLDIGRHYKSTLSSTEGSYTRKGFIIESHDLKHDILLPKYYNPDIEKTLNDLQQTGLYEICDIGTLVKDGLLSIKRGDEVGSNNYGTGNVPFIRTSELANWEIIADPTHCLAEDIYQKYRSRQDLREGDILIVNDGTYLMGRTAILSKHDTKIVIQSHIRRIRCLKPDFILPYLLLYLLGLEITQLQIESKTFRQATISTLGNRLLEVKLPIPKDENVRESISKEVKEIVDNRADQRHKAMTMKFQGELQNVIGIRNKAKLGNL